jgi:hypothetical protein
MSMVQRADLPTELHWVLLDVNLAPQVALITARRLAAHPRPALMGVLLTLKLDDWKAVHHVPRFLKSISSMGMLEVKATQLPSNRMELFVCGLTKRGLERPHRAVERSAGARRRGVGLAATQRLSPAATRGVSARVARIRSGWLSLVGDPRSGEGADAAGGRLRRDAERDRHGEARERAPRR